MNQKLTIHSKPDEIQAYHTERAADSLDMANEKLDGIGSSLQNLKDDSGTLKKLDEVTQAIKSIPASPVPKDFPSEMEVSIKGVSVLTLKGDTGEQGNDGKDGRDGKDGKNGVDGKPGVPGKQGIGGKNGVDGLDGKDGRDGSSDTVEQISEKINSKFNHLDFRTLKNIPDFALSKDQGGGGGSIITFRNSSGNLISAYVTDIQFGTGITPTYANGKITITASAGTNITPRAETPTGTVDGANTTFTLANTPIANLSVIFTLDGIVQRNGSGLDYTVSGTTITFVTAPVAGTEVFAYYNS